ncbi:hypothetical protein PC120_g24342 [Phytophthora cactorum]|nr:hypothetical protein PC120_g24342 [Phytophthora cactorum]
MMADKKANKEEKKSHQPFDGNEFEMLLERVTLNLQQKGLWKYCERERLKKRFVGQTYFEYAEEMAKLRRSRLDPTGNVTDHLGEVRRLMERGWWGLSCRGIHLQIQMILQITSS